MRASRLLAAVLATAFLAAVAVAGDPGREYLRGVKAFEARAWTEAVPALRTAIAADRREGIRRLRVTGVVFEDYFPWAYLGLSLEKLGEREEARAALEESEKQGAIRGAGALEREVSGALARLRVLPTPAATAALPPTPTPVPAVTSAPAPTAAAIASPTSRPQPSVAPTSRVVPDPIVPTEAVPARLTTAVEEGIVLHFQARYDESIAILGPEAERSAIARLFLAFSLAGEALLVEPADESALETARREFRRAAAGGAAPRPGHVSPRILQALGAEVPSRRTP
jgi:hypothetical protein